MKAVMKIVVAAASSIAGATVPAAAQGRPPQASISAPPALQ